MKTTAKKQNRIDVYQMVTDRIVEQLGKGIIPWHRPWTGASLEDGGAINYVTRKPYSMINQLLLGRAGEWLTWKQIQDSKGSIKKGAKAGIVVFYQMTVKNVTVRVKDEETGEERDEQRQQQRPVLKYYNVFHIEDCDGIESKITETSVEPSDTLKPIEHAEDVINGYLSREKELKFKNDEQSGRAYYSPSEDAVVVPMMNQYEIVEEYYSTTFHELVHSTKKESRCNRKGEERLAAFGSEDYSREELVAEMGSAMLCTVTGLDCEKAFKNSVAYIQSWLKALKNDNKMIVWAASRAEKAAKYILNEK